MTIISAQQITAIPRLDVSTRILRVPAATIARADDSCDPTLGCVFQDLTNTCDDGSLCTEDSCNPQTGCEFEDISATCDEDACTEDSCSPFQGCINTPSAPCDDGNACTEDVCDSLIGCTYTQSTRRVRMEMSAQQAEVVTAGECVGGTNVDCDDGVECTIDSCSPDAGCVHTASDSACDDDEVFRRYMRPLGRVTQCCRP